MTQEKFAEVSGFTQAYISWLELGRRNPTVLSLSQLAEALRCKPIDLLVEDIDPAA